MLSLVRVPVKFFIHDFIFSVVREIHGLGNTQRCAENEEKEKKDVF
jgi:hypothetical protein